MRLYEFIQVARRVEAQGIDDPADFMKSIHSLVKNNGGNWKSDRQAKYLLIQAKRFWSDSKSSQNQKVAEQWAKKFGFDFKGTLSDNCIVLALITGWGPAKRDVTKIRALGWLVVLDNGGVAALGKVKVQHPTKAKKPLRDWDFIPNTIQTTFEKKTEPTIVVDFFEENRKRSEEDLARRKKNEPLVQKIKAIPGYEKSSFLKDMVGILERGYELTPRQMATVNKYLPDTERQDIGLGDWTEWKDDLKTFGDLVEERIVPALVEFYTTINEQQQKEWDEASEDKRRWLTKPDTTDRKKQIESWWADWQSGGGPPQTYFWLDTDLIETIEDVAKARVREIHLQGWVWDLRTRVQRAIKAKGKKLAKNTISAITSLKLINKKLQGTSPQAIRQFWMRKLEQEKAASVGRDQDWKPVSHLIRWPRGETIADLIRGWDPSTDGIYFTQPDPNEVLNPKKEGTSGVPENWEEDPRWEGNPNKYKREMNRCPPGYATNEDGFCLPETNLQRKRRERINRTKPTRLKNRGTENRG